MDRIIRPYTDLQLALNLEAKMKGRKVQSFCPVCTWPCDIMFEEHDLGMNRVTEFLGWSCQHCRRVIECETCAGYHRESTDLKRTEILRDLCSCPPPEES